MNFSSLRVPFILLLSLIPGLGHLALKKYRKGISLLCMAAGALAILIFPAWIILKLVAGVIYLSLIINAGVDSYLLMAGKAEIHSSKPYVTFLLLSCGFSALPMLWQSPRFCRAEKIGWTIAVPILAILFFGLLFVFGSRIEALLGV